MNNKVIDNKINNNNNNSDSKINYNRINNKNSFLDREYYTNIYVEKKYKKVSLPKQSIMNSASNLKAYTKTNKKLPNYVTIDGEKFSMGEALYLYSKTIQS